MTHHPVEIFHQWFTEASQSEPHPTAFILSTATPDGRPSSRVMLMKHYDESGFVFYTNLMSRKGRELQHNSPVALCFYWHSVNKQVRIEGKVIPVDSIEADQYFQSRPRASQLSAWASKQSQPMADRAIFMERIKQAEEKFAGQSVIPRPDFWSGFRVIPEKIEFWEDKAARRHERLLFFRDHENKWVSEQLFP